MTENINKSIDTHMKMTYEHFRNYRRIHFLIGEMRPLLSNAKTLLDIGCAKGELIYLLKEEFPYIDYTGLEYDQGLISLATKEPSLKDVDFVCGDARTFELGKVYDITVMSGVLSIFDDFETPLKSMLRHTGKGGSGFIFGMFNRYDVDVILRYRNNTKGSSTWESGLNNFSLKTIMNFLNKYVENLTVKEFKLDINLEISSDPIVSYTLNTDERGKIILNGTGILIDFYLIHFTRNP
jgi:trans-aconitate methyltransferase